MPASLLTVTPLTASGIPHKFYDIPFGPIAWYDATQIAGISSGASLSVWTDLSGNGFHLQQASAVSQPQWKSNVQNGNAVVQFLAANKETLSNATFTAASANTYSAFVVSNSSTTGAQHGIYDVSAGAVTNKGNLLFVNSNLSTVAARVVAGAGTTVDISTLSTYDTSFKLYSMILGGSSSIFSFRVNGVSQGTTSFVTANSNALDSLTVGALAGVTLPLNGNVGELLLYGRACTITEIQRIESYLTAKWGL